MEKQGICSLTHTPPPLPRASLVGLVGGAIPPSLAFHPAAKVSIPMESGKVRASPLSPPLRTVLETFALTRLKPYFKLVDLDLECTCL
jgi:hypothetical protein